MFSCSEIIAQASDALAHLNIPHTLQNTLQAKFPSYNETLSYKIHVHSSSTFHAIMEALSTFGFIKSFNFTAILAAFFGSTLSSTFNFTSLQKLDPIPLIEIFEHCNIPYSQTHNTLIFIATPSNIEEAILAALDLSISIPPSFLSSAKRLLFEHSNESLSVRLLQLSESGVIELQIARMHICTSSGIFFEPSFLIFLQRRFHMINQPQLCTVRNHAGEIREVLSLTSSTALFHTITRDSLPVPFVHNGMNFALFFLQPLFHKQQRPAISYPFESQEEHFQRFQNTSDSLASRIPLLTPHSQYGGPIARDINISLASGFFGNPQHPTSFLFAPPPSSFYILLAPFDNNIYNFLPDLFPQVHLSLRDIPHHELTLHSPHFILFDIPPRKPFDIPHFLQGPSRLSTSGWITVLPFSTCKIILIIHSEVHSSLLVKHLTKLLVDSPITLTIGIPTPAIISLDPNPSADVSNDITMEEDLPEIPDDPTLFSHSALLLMCYRILAYFAWPKNFDHPRQKLLNCVAGGLHLSDPLIKPILSAALETFADDYFSHPITTLSLLNKLSIGLPASVITALFPKTLTDNPTQTLYCIPIPSFPQTTDADQLKLAFSQIFNSMPTDLAISITQSTLLFSSDNLALLHLPIIAELISTSFTITLDSRKRTSESKRPLVLKLVSVLIESDSSDSEVSPSSEIEKYHPDSCSVTIYDPHKGIYILPLSSLLSHNVLALAFKRSFQKSLSCPKLIQQFCTLSIKPPISSNPSPFSIISLFDGSGSFTDVIANALDQWPHAILAAEMDADTRSVVSKVKGWPAEGCIWAFDKKEPALSTPKMCGLSSWTHVYFFVNFYLSFRLIVSSSWGLAHPAKTLPL